MAFYVTRGAFGNPVRDRSRLVAVGTLVSDPDEAPVRILDDDLPFSVAFRIDHQVKTDLRTTAPEVAPIAGNLSFVKRPEVWGQYFRNTPFEISEDDFNALASLLK